MKDTFKQTFMLTNIYSNHDSKHAIHIMHMNVQRVAMFKHQVPYLMFVFIVFLNRVYQWNTYVYRFIIHLHTLLRSFTNQRTADLKHAHPTV